MKCELISCERVILAVEAESLYARTPLGWLGILPRHAPAAFVLENAPLRIRTKEGERELHVKTGFIHVSPGEVLIFVDEIEGGHAP